jgi:hypothetical protein
MDNPDREKLVTAFEHMIDSVNESVHSAEEALAPTIDEMVHNAELLVRDIYRLTEEEAESLGATLKRDMHKANQVLNEQSKEIGDWLSFDIDLIEDRFLDLIAQAADKTWLEFHAFENDNMQMSEYRSGEVCTAGSFACQQCGEILRLSSNSQIPPFANCGHDVYHRVSR